MLIGVEICNALGPCDVPPIVARLMVLFARPGLNTIVSRVNGVASALRTACRKLPPPESLRFLTRNVAGTTRSSSTSTVRRRLDIRRRADRHAGCNPRTPAIHENG